MLPNFAKVPRSSFLSVKNPERYQEYRKVLMRLAQEGFFDRSARIGWSLATQHNDRFDPYGKTDPNWIYQKDFRWYVLADFMERDNDSLYYRLPRLTLEEVIEVGKDIQSCQ